MIHKINRTLRINVKNIPGWHTKRKILIIEADDWGSIRMPSNETYFRLKKWKRDLVGENVFDKFDTIESAEDLYALFRLLKSYRDKNGNFAKMTPFCNVANPDFGKIKNDNFQTYHYKTYKETIDHYQQVSSIFDLWEQGIKEGIFFPQYHGREHLTVPLYMRYLQTGNEDLLFGFENEFCSVPLNNMPAIVKSFRPGFYFDNQEDFSFLENALTDGVLIFRDTFGINPDVFCPSNAVFHDKFKPLLLESGIKTTVETGKRYIPDGNGGYTTKYYINGRKDKSGIITYGRNCLFEPLKDGLEISLKNVMNQIKASFRWRKPAIIATHRVNFVGGLYNGNREMGLKALGLLLEKVLETWPDVEFMNSSEFSKLIHNYLEK